MLLAQLLRSLFNALPGNKYFAKGRFLETPKNICFGSHGLPYVGLFTYYHCLDHGNYPEKKGFSWAFFVPHLNSSYPHLVKWSDLQGAFSSGR